MSRAASVRNCGRRSLHVSLRQPFRPESCPMGDVPRPAWGTHRRPAERADSRASSETLRPSRNRTGTCRHASDPSCQRAWSMGVPPEREPNLVRHQPATNDEHRSYWEPRPAGTTLLLERALPYPRRGARAMGQFHLSGALDEIAAPSRVVGTGRPKLALWGRVPSEAYAVLSDGSLHGRILINVTLTSHCHFRSIS